VAVFDDDAGSVSLGPGEPTGGRGWLRVRPSEFLFANSDSVACDAAGKAGATK